ncbi:serine/threonine-protein kinase [Gimesia algae]|uniref:Serine/threonine-protein kinase StkP n=1 Tax=Gimesia algae TaxID=2527971 RepID=A0A517VBK6_9PLAN|nr:serine/threonine-protein kinase [Gimesia algae]QDT90391.1 Serine/threonine-protein kinase StkP [Gimesia algae]
MQKCISDSQIVHYLCNELDELENQYVQEHLNQCASCQKRTENYSEDKELKNWQECQQRQNQSGSSEHHPFSEQQLDRIFNSTISSINQPPSTAYSPSPHPGSGIHSQVDEELNQITIRVVGNYHLVEKIGQGGMGVVYRAIHARLKKQVVLKLLLNNQWDNDTQTQRFYREMELIGRLDHPNIVKATDAGEVDETCFLVMEYLSGHDLKTIIKSEKKISITSACYIVRQVANGLQYIHNHNLIHRDIKPSNLFLTLQGEVKVLDLGLAGLSQTNKHLSDLTDSQCIMGSVHYMAPEQAHSVKTIDHRADIYSLGCTFYKLLTGQTPFKQETQIATILAHREETAPRLSDLIPEIPEQLEELFQSMMKKDPVDRIQTMAEIVEILDRFLSQQNEIPLNESAETYLSESRELIELCKHTILTPPIEVMSTDVSTQMQASKHFVNQKRGILFLALILLFGLGTWGIGKALFPLPPPLEEPDPAPRHLIMPSPDQAQIEREAAVWLLNHDCEIVIDGIYEPVTQSQNLPEADFFIRQIKFHPQKVTREIMAPLKGLAKLEILRLEDCHVMDDALAPLNGKLTLKTLDLHETGLTNAGLSHISSLLNLTHISLQKNREITDEGLLALADLKKLSSINLDRLNITDSGLKFINHNPRLEWLNIKDTQITDNSIPDLIKLNRMKHLYLEGSKISDQGIQEIRNAYTGRDPIKY